MVVVAVGTTINKQTALGSIESREQSMYFRSVSDLSKPDPNMDSDLDSVRVHLHKTVSLELSRRLGGGGDMVQQDFAELVGTSRVQKAIRAAHNDVAWDPQHQSVFDLLEWTADCFSGFQFSAGTRFPQKKSPQL
ncbi:hypothetical protein S83_069419 [Arachis hypogaea]|uniref:Uncharacterized protein n=1 Tax=Arachis hypogaea TaxID=3818 RepID=A0A444WZB6_ARAHY|nr:hypothetical protein Ahy_B10g101313 isoform D [Arachis hypogaea]